MAQIHIRMVRISFERLEFAASNPVRMRSNGLNLHSNASNPVRMVQICFRIRQIPFEWFEFAFECVESRSNGLKVLLNGSNPASNGLNLHLNPSNPVRIVGIGIRMSRIPFEWLDLAFECFESRSNGSNFDLNASNPVRMVGICI